MAASRQATGINESAPIRCSRRARYVKPGTLVVAPVQVGTATHDSTAGHQAQCVRPIPRFPEARMRHRDPVTRARARRTSAAGLIAIIALSTCVAATPVAAAGAGTAPAAQRLTWTSCAGIDSPGLQCADVAVPLDYARPAGRKITVAISRLPARDPARRHGILLMTGGGPGNAGVPLPVQWGAVLSPDILATYDLVGFDVRFVERSTPLTCGQPGEEPGGFWVRTAGFASFGVQAEQARQYARDCQRNAGWALPYATTANAARDMDRIRAALGADTISFLSGSFRRSARRHLRHAVPAPGRPVRAG
jgi:hypothetical protein